MKKIILSKKEEDFVNQLDKSTLQKIMTPRNDLIFKKLFGAIGREKIVKDFLEAILDLKIQSVELGKETIILPEEINERVGVLDVKVVLNDGTEVDIEMQNTQNYFTIKRAHFYASKMYSKQLKIGENFNELKKVIVIFITNFNIFNKIENYHTKWLMTEHQNSNENFDEIELHFIEMPKFLHSKYDKKRKIDQWLLFLDYSQKELLKEIMKENENVKEAEENLEKLQADKHAQYLAWLRDKQIWDTNSIRVGAMQEGHAEGKAQGIAEGRIEGRAEGREEGINEGMAKEKIETVKRMLKQKLDIEIIMASTELSKEEIEKIINEMPDENK